jgi:hypothetical protein
MFLFRFWRLAGSSADANVSEKHTFSISPFPALKMETVCSSETLASTDESTQRQNPEEKHHLHLREKLNSTTSNNPT